MSTVVRAAIVAALLCLLLASGTASAQYGPTPEEEPAGTVSVQDDEVEPGGDLVLTGSGFLAGTQVLGVLTGPNGQEMARVTVIVDEDGTFRLVIAMPADAPCGVYVVTVTGTAADGSPRTTSQEVTVSGCPAGGPGGTGGGSTGGGGGGAGGGVLAFTGLEVGALLALALGLLGVGIIVVRASRRRTDRT